ncbi:hypothetical protein KDD93_05605 [Campylobacter sp. faydin G-24]|uniref:Transformation system protein n=1 Tax=Campylobacter anatolicus TaxID=2829105 RepID=A0ABS5HKJ4_9BACT|nr:hypothetical protein [Campylobacter anatolicus]MBR8464047.1 hypothetical protein [Campylobacter anatolicus]
MKILALLFCFVCVVFSLDYNDMISSIKEPRIGLSKDELNSVKDPFKEETFDKNLTNEMSKIGDLALTAIINNRAKINSKWVKVGEKIDEFSLIKIGKSSVTLVKNGEKIELNLNGNKNVAIKIQ